jgi:hypothetical protein
MISIEILGEIVHVRFSISIDSCFSQYSLISWANFAHIRMCASLSNQIPSIPTLQIFTILMVDQQILSTTSTLLNFMPPHFFFHDVSSPLLIRNSLMFDPYSASSPLLIGRGLLFHHRSTSSTSTSNPLLDPLL